MAAFKSFLIIVDDCDYILGFRGLNENWMNEDSFYYLFNRSSCRETGIPKRLTLFVSEMSQSGKINVAHRPSCPMILHLRKDLEHNRAVGFHTILAEGESQQGVS